MPKSMNVALSASSSLRQAFQREFPTIEHFLTSEQRFPRLEDTSNGKTGDNIVSEPLEYLREQVMPDVVSGLDLAESDVIISTGCAGIDALLSGSLRGGSLLEITGASATGKTQVCHMAAATVAQNPSGGRVVYVDTSNSFSPGRLVQLFSAGSPVDAHLSNVAVFRLHDIHQVIALIENLSIEMGNVEDPSMRPTLLVLDSISSIVSPVLGGGGQHKQGHTLMIALGRALKLMALKYNLGVLCTNHEVGSSEEPRAALGEQWTNQVGNYGCTVKTKRQLCTLDVSASCSGLYIRQQPSCYRLPVAYVLVKNIRMNGDVVLACAWTAELMNLPDGQSFSKGIEETRLIRSLVVFHHRFRVYTQVFTRIRLSKGADNVRRAEIVKAGDQPRKIQSLFVPGS